jgi:3-methyladenine DNA glycosylase/8-oxoguanine DNA glycosylase/superfamily II DNA or RNA helicase
MPRTSSRIRSCSSSNNSKSQRSAVTSSSNDGPAVYIGSKVRKVWHVLYNLLSAIRYAPCTHTQYPIIQLLLYNPQFFKGHGWFNGEVTSLEDSFYMVVYEDDDSETMELKDLKRILISKGKANRDPPMMEVDSDDDNIEEEEELYTQENDVEGSDSDASSLEYDEDSVVPANTNQTPAKPTKRTASVTPSPISMKASTPKTKKVKAKAAESSPSKKEAPMKNKAKPRTIAFRGLPRGALAKCPISGLTIRSLESISPLHSPSVSSLNAAIKTKSAAKIASDTPLSGKFLVVNRDHQAVCPAEFVGNTFASAAELYNGLTQKTDRALLNIDYDMEVVADPVFAPWEFIQARLDSSGLLDVDQDEKTKDLGPLLFVVQMEWDGNSKVSGTVSWYTDYDASTVATKSDLLWAIVEASQRDTPSVLVGAPLALLEHTDRSVKQSQSGDFEERQQAPENIGNEEITAGCDEDLVPPPSTKVAQLHLPASLLQKAIRRGTGLCSNAPLLEACAALLLPKEQKHDNESKSVAAGSTLAMLKTVWGCMLVDASPFEDADDCFGLPSLMLLSLVAKADPAWTMPAALCRAAVAGALRTAKSAPSQPWLGFVERSDEWWRLEAVSSNDVKDQKACNLRNILRAAQTAVGGRIAWGKWSSFVGDASAAAVLSYLNIDKWDGSYLKDAPLPLVDESTSLQTWEAGMVSIVQHEPRFRLLDEECRRAAVEPTVMPATLVLLQALLSEPPTKWKKHGLPALSKQIRKLVSEANARIKERVQLARLATWGKEDSIALEGKSNSRGPFQREAVSVSANYQSFREVVTPTGTLSEQEMEVVDCFGAIQDWVSGRLSGTADQGLTADNMTLAAIQSSTTGTTCPYYIQIKAGPPLTPFDRRVAFLLAFSTSIEVEVVIDPQSPSSKELVSAMFCGDTNEPLLVQRIGKARKEGKEAATAGGTTSGATAVPSLGYVQRGRSVAEAKLIEAVEVAVAEHWKDGNTAPLPLPPAGLQWDLPSAGESNDIGWEAKETSVTRTVELIEDESGNRSWSFTIAGVPVDAFDAGAVVSPCALDLEDQQHRPETLEPGSERDCCVRLALYVKDGSTKSNLPNGRAVLEAMSMLHTLAESDRKAALSGLSEGRVYDWMPLVTNSLLPSRTWRDALLAIRTRENDFVVLGKGVGSDGTGAPRDMVEGVLVRVFHGLEMLYPQAIRKEGAFKFRIRPRGAAYYHLLASLERLGRGEGLNRAPLARIAEPVTESVGEKRRAPSVLTGPKLGIDVPEESQPRKRPRRSAAVAASKKAAAIIADEQVPTRKAKSSETEVDDAYMAGNPSSDSKEEEEVLEETLPLPKIKTTLWAHQEQSVSKVVGGVFQGRRGHADASAVGAGKTLTALATIVRLAEWIQTSGRSRHGVLVMLPTKALIREWLLEIAAHTEGFHVIEQREDGTLFSLTYGKTHPPIDGNALIISTLDRVCNHPFVRQSAWDFVVIDECLSVQNAAAKRNPSAWRQIEVSTCGVLMLSATFFRSKFDQLFYMIRMLRSPLPRTIEWLPATIHEHIVCQVPETDRTWHLKAEMVPLPPQDLKKYRGRIEAFCRKQINEPTEVDGRKLWVDLESIIRFKYEGRDSRASYCPSSPMGDAFVKAAKELLRKGRRPLIFADTSKEQDFILQTLNQQGMDAQTWASIASRQIASSSESTGRNSKTVIVANKTVEGSGINMQRHADAILCRPTPGDHLEQMKGRVDRPGQSRKDLLLVVLVCEHTIEEAKFSNIRLAGNFFREYIAPVATKYKERIDLEATLAAGGTEKLKSGTVSRAWRSSLEAAGQSGAFAKFDDSASTCTTASSTQTSTVDFMEDDFDYVKKPKPMKDKEEPKYKPLNKVLVNKGDPKAVRQAKSLAKSGQASPAVRYWLFPPKAARATREKGSLPKDSLLRFSDATPPVVLDRDTVYKAVTHLSNGDPKLAALIARVGADALVSDCKTGSSRAPTQARLFDKCVRSITFTMISVDAGNAFLRRLAIKIGVCLEAKPAAARTRLLGKFLRSIKEGGNGRELTSPEMLLELLLGGKHAYITFTSDMARELVNDCEVLKGKRSGYPHLCGVTHPCGKNDDHSVFLEKARAQTNGGGNPVSCGFSSAKAGFIISLVDDFDSGKISGEKISKASDRDAAKILMELKGIGDWCAGGILMHWLGRANILLYGDLTVRNFLNDLYDINHLTDSETLIESAADFDDSGLNRNLIDKLAEEKGWAPYKSVVCYLMYHLQEENLVLL